MVSCDDTRLRRAVTNILSNGVRYACSQLRLTCRADKRHVTIRIQDDGDGIAEEDLPTSLIASTWEKAENPALALP